MPTAAGAKPDSRACAACRHQRRKCRDDCQWAEFFPAALPQTFANARSLYGLRNMSELTKHLPPELRRVAMETIIFESNMRAFDRVGGCYRMIRDLAARARLVECELRRAHQLLALLRGSGHSVNDNAENNSNLGFVQKSGQGQEQEVLLHDYFVRDDIAASSSSCRVDGHPGVNLLLSDRPSTYLDEQLSSGTIPVMEGTSLMYNDRLELDPNSTASQLYLPGTNSLRTADGTNSPHLGSVYKRDQPLDFLELKSLHKINKQSPLLQETSSMDDQSKINKDRSASQLFSQEEVLFNLKDSTKAMAWLS